MKKILIVLFLLMPALASADTYVNEDTTIKDAGYTEVGNGINYDTGGGVFAPSSPTIVDNGGSWSVTTSPLEWVIDKADRTFTYTSGDKSITLKPVGVYYVDKASWDFAQVGALQVPTVDVNATDIVFSDLFPNVDMEVYSNIGGPTVDYVINSKAGYPSAASQGMDSATTWVGIVHEITGANLPAFEVDSGLSWAGTDSSFIRLHSTGKSFDVVPSLATSADDPALDSTYVNIRNFLVEKGGTKYFVEAVPYEWFLGKTTPIRYHYTTITSFSGDYTFLSGTEYYMNGYLSSGANNLVVEGGAVLKWASNRSLTIAAGGTFNVTGTATNRAYFTSCKDLTVGANPGPAGEANCTEALGGSNWRGIKMDDELDVSIVGAEFRYCGDSTVVDACIDAASLNRTNDDITITDSVFYDWASGVTPGSNSSAIRYKSAPNANLQLVTIKDNFFYHVAHTGTVASSAAIYADTQNNSNASTLVDIENNLIYISGETLHYAVYLYASTINKSIHFENNSMYCASATTTYPNIFLRNSIVYNNITEGCESITSTGSTIDYNIWYNLFDGDAGAGANGSYADPVFSSHAHSGDGVPSWADAYHVDTATSPAVDMGNTTVSGDYATSHVTDDGNSDTGTLDIGYHFPDLPPSLPDYEFTIEGVDFDGVSL